MLPAPQRLRRSRDFDAVFRHGRRAGAPGRRLVVHLMAGVRTAPPPPPPRAGVVVSRAVGGAVTRSTVKRRLRHLLRDRLAGLAPGTAVVVRALPAAARATSVELDADLGAALDRLQKRGSR